MSHDPLYFCSVSCYFSFFISEASQQWSLQAVGWGQVLVPKWWPLGALAPMNIPWGLCHPCLCPQSEPYLIPASPGDPLRSAGRSGPGSYEASALPWVPVHMKPGVHPPRVESLFPPVLWSSCTQVPLAFKAKSSDAPPNARPSGWGAWCGAQYSHFCGKTSVIYLFSSLGVAHPVGIGFDFITKVSFLLSCCGFFFVFWCRISFLVGSKLLLLMVVQQLVVILMFSWKEVSSSPSTPLSCLLLPLIFHRCITCFTKFKITIW